MITVLTFSVLAALLVFFAGRKDAACDPRLSSLLLALLLAMPLLVVFMPKLGLLPAAPAAAADAAWPWRETLAAIWMLGFLLLLARLFLSMWGLHRWRKRSVRVDRVEGVEIRELAGLSSPVAAGVCRPVIFMPLSWREWSQDRRALVMAHELAHHRRRDPLWRFLSLLVCAVHWYHPLVHWMSRRLALQCEFACDQAVLRSAPDAKTYARLLCDFAEGGRVPAPALPMAAGSFLESRVGRICQPPRRVRARTGLALGVLGILAAGALAALGPGPGGEATSPEEVELRWSADPFPAR